MPKDFGPPERAPVLPRKKTLSGSILFTGFVQDPFGHSGFCVQVVSVVLAWAWGLVASPSMLPSSTEEVGGWATWAQEVSSLVS